MKMVRKANIRPLYFVGFLILAFGVIVPANKSYTQSTVVSASQDTLLERREWLPSPKGAMIRSLIFPGWGQWYNGKTWKAALVCATELGIIGASFYWDNKAKNTQNELFRLQYQDNRRAAFWFLGLAILISMGDAYVDAHLAGFDVSPDLALNSNNRRMGLMLSYRF